MSSTAWQTSRAMPPLRSHCWINKERPMPKLAANLSMLFTEHAFMDRFEHAARSGFRAVEFLFPYAFDANQIADKLGTFQLDLVLHNLLAGNWEAGERGIACHPD